MRSVSVIIPCRNEAEFIEQLLDAVRAQDLAPSA
jgi:glycosyltransferase involved in cell wall biosynthesis